MMKIIFARFIILFSFCILVLASTCPPSMAAQRRVEECGIESYISRADPSCGVANYISTRSVACGVERYKEGKSKNCPGYYSTLDYWVNADFMVVRCPPPSKETGERRVSGTECSESDRGRCYKIYAYQCFAPEYIPKCRIPELGVELYNQCRDPAHGVESYNTCSRQEFGVSQFKECEIRKTRVELTAYIQGLETNIDVIGGCFDTEHWKSLET